MSEHDNIDFILRSWEFQPGAVASRIVQGDDGRDVIQLRIDLGLLQLEVQDRPDGTRPHGAASMLEYLRGRLTQGDEFKLTDEECFEVDREFVQFYHRRICWLQLQRFEAAVKDADHTLGLMDVCKEVSPDEQWTAAHEQYRPLVLFHRTQAASLFALEDEGAEKAIEEINEGLNRVQKVFEEYGVADHFEEDELVVKLREVREDIRKRFDVGPTLYEQLADAVAREQYEIAANLRDEIAKREGKR